MTKLPFLLFSLIEVVLSLLYENSVKFLSHSLTVCLETFSVISNAQDRLRVSYHFKLSQMNNFYTMFYLITSP